MKKIITLFTIILSVFIFTSCEKNDDTPAITEINYVGIESDFIVGVDPNGSTTEEVSIASSQIMSSDRTFNLVVDDELTTADASAYTVPSTVTIPANSNVGTFSIDVVGSNVNPSGADLVVIGLTSSDNDVSLDEPISLNLKQICPLPETILSITFDSWPEEIYWRILDSVGNTLFESAALAYGAYSGLTGGVDVSFCLASGTYTFEIYDSFGDGAGPYSITQDGNVLVSSSGGYGGGEARVFVIP